MTYQYNKLGYSASQRNIGSRSGGCFLPEVDKKAFFRSFFIVTPKDPAAKPEDALFKGKPSAHALLKHGKRLSRLSARKDWIKNAKARQIEN